MFTHSTHQGGECPRLPLASSAISRRLQSPQVSVLSGAAGRGVMGTAIARRPREWGPLELPWVRTAASSPRDKGIWSSSTSDFARGDVILGGSGCVYTLPPPHRPSKLCIPHLHSGHENAYFFQSQPQLLEILCHVSLWKNHGSLSPGVEFSRRGMIETVLSGNGSLTEWN